MSGHGQFHRQRESSKGKFDSSFTTIATPGLRATGQANRNIKLTSSKIEYSKLNKPVIIPPCTHAPSAHSHTHIQTHMLALSKLMQFAPWPAALFM